MNNIPVKMMSDDVLAYVEKNLEEVTSKIKENPTNKWIYDDFGKAPFIKKKWEIPDFELKENPAGQDKKIDFENALAIYNALSSLPRYILCDERFWLWLEFEKFYPVARTLMPIDSKTTIKDHWMFGQGVRRGLMFGIFSRLYFRVALSIEEGKEDKYELTRWLFDNPERFRNMSWRSYSSEAHLVRGALRGEKRAIEETGGNENADLFTALAKYISLIGSVRLLDKISEEDMEAMVYNKAVELLKAQEKK